MPNEKPTLAAVIAANAARLCAERGLTLQEATRLAGLPPDALKPMDGVDFDLDAVTAVAGVLGVEPAELADEGPHLGP